MINLRGAIFSIRAFAQAIYSIALLLALLLNPSAAFSDQNDDATAAFSRGDYNRAYEIWSDLADDGDVEATYQLGLMYLEGIGVERSVESGVAFIRDAAKSGHIEAQYVLGVMYSTGRLISRDMEQAIFWKRKAAEGGNRSAQLDLAKLYWMLATPDGRISALAWTEVALSLTPSNDPEHERIESLWESFAQKMSVDERAEAAHIASKWSQKKNDNTSSN